MMLKKQRSNSLSLPRTRAATGQSAAEAAAAFQRARSLVLRSGWHTMAYQILNPGIDHWFSSQGDAVVGYVTAQGYRVVAGEPVCPPERLAAVASSFEADTRRAGQRVCYLGAQDRLVMSLDSDRPLAGLLLGAQPAWKPHNWPDLLARKASLRAQLSRARNKKVQVRAYPTEQAQQSPELRRCLQEWLHNRRLPPLHFSVEPETLGRLEDRHVLVAERQGDIVGFLVASPIPLRNGWLIEQIIRRPTAPNGTTELLLDAAMRHLAALGSEYVTLGVSPLSRRAGIIQSSQPFGTRLVFSLVRSYGNHFYNFEGLDAYKAKFLPEWWEPVYAITREGHTSLRTLYAVSGAFSGTSPLVYVGHALAWAAAQECRSRWQALRRRLA
jgi:phosphatidylglycerol lysyltransferase